SESARIAAIESGSVDAVAGLTPNEFNEIQKRGKAKVLGWNGNLYLELGLNYGFEPWNGGGDQKRAKLLRKAVAYALTYNQIIQKDYFGHATKWNGLINSKYYGAKQYPGMYTTDVGKAKSLLAQAGYPNGKGLSGPGLALTYTAEHQATLEPVATDI